MGSIPGSGKSHGEENDNSLQYSCLENPMTEESGGSQRVKCGGSPCSPRDSQESSPTPQFKSINSSSWVYTARKPELKETCTPVFITALFIVARTWKQPRCPSADKWISKLWYLCTMEYYSAIKKDTFESVLMRWMRLDSIIQSEVSQKKKHQYSMLMQIKWNYKYGNDNPRCK